MSNRLIKAIFLVLVLSLAFLITAPAFSGENPWDSDQVNKDTITFDPYFGDTLLDSILVGLDDQGDDDSSNLLIIPESWINVFVQVFSTLSGVI